MGSLLHYLAGWANVYRDPSVSALRRISIGYSGDASSLQMRKSGAC